MKETKVKQIER